MNMFGRTLMGLFAIASFLLVGCATTVDSKNPMPKQLSPIKVTFVNEELSGWTDTPPGVYRIPDSQVIVSGFKKSGAPGILFGGLGVLVQGAASSNSAKSATKSLSGDALTFNLSTKGQNLSDEYISSGKYLNTFTTKGEQNSPVLNVISAVVVTFSSDTEARPYVVLKASLSLPNAKKPIWSNRYIASIGKTMPFEGASSLTENNGEALKRLSAASLDSAINLMLSDISNPIPRSEEKLVVVEGAFAFLRNPLKVTSYLLQEDEKNIIYSPNQPVNGNTISGVSIVDRSVVSHTPAKAGEMFIKEK